MSFKFWSLPSWHICRSYINVWESRDWDIFCDFHSSIFFPLPYRYVSLFFWVLWFVVEVFAYKFVEFILKNCCCTYFIFYFTQCGSSYLLQNIFLFEKLIIKGGESKRISIWKTNNKRWRVKTRCQTRFKFWRKKIKLVFNLGLIKNHWLYFNVGIKRYKKN